MIQTTVDIGLIAQSLPFLVALGGSAVGYGVSKGRVTALEARVTGLDGKLDRLQASMDVIGRAVAGIEGELRGRGRE